MYIIRDRTSFTDVKLCSENMDKVFNLIPPNWKEGTKFHNMEDAENVKSILMKLGHYDVVNLNLVVLSEYVSEIT